MRGACLCPKACCARIRRGGRCRVNRLRHIVDGVAVDESRRRGSRSDVDLARIVDIARRRIGVAVDAALIARCNGQRTLFNRQRPRGRGDVVVRSIAAATRGERRALDTHRIAADARTLRDGISAAVHRCNGVICEAVTRNERARMRRARAHRHAVVRRTVDALTARRCEVNIARRDRQLARHVFERVVARREIAVRQANRVLARMNRALRKARCLCRVRNRGIGNSPREQSRRRRRLAVREVREGNAVISRIVVRRTVVVDGLRLARDRDFARHDAVVDRDLVVEVVMPRIGNFLVGNRGSRPVGACTCTHGHIICRIRHRAVCRMDVGIDIRLVRCAETMRI